MELREGTQEFVGFGFWIDVDVAEVREQLIDQLLGLADLVASVGGNDRQSPEAFSERFDGDAAVCCGERCGEISGLDLSGGELFVDMSDDDRRGVPDGMKVDEDGQLWSTGAGGVWVVDGNGERLGVFEMEEHAANLAFGGADYSTLFLTAQTSVYRVETSVRGIAPRSRG